MNPIITSPAERHVMYSLCNAPVRTWPYAHFYVENVFPRDFYATILEYLRENAEYSAASPFANRAFAREVKIPGIDFLSRPCFLNAMINLFRPQFLERFPNGVASMYKDLRLVRDGLNYKIGPHTDAKWKVLSLLFYLPPTDEFEQFGTSIYTPRDAAMRCPGGPHHPFEPFDRVWTAPFRPNSCFGFWKTDNSFHGVEPIPVSFNRDVLLYNIYERNTFNENHDQPLS